nr:MAG TPA: FaeA-like protein [Caudoviricetes sp.]
MRPSESLKVAGRPIAYYPKLAKPLGGVNAAILFGHFFYWHDKTENPLGVYRTAEEIEDETGLSVQEQRTARSKLKERGVLIETEKRIEHRIYYKLDLNAFDDLMLQHSGSEESTAPKCNINSPEMQNQHSGSEESTAVIRTEDLTEDLTVNTPLPPNAADGGNGLNADAFVPADAGTCKQGEDGVLQEETTVTPALKTNRAGGNTRRSRYNQVPCQDIADCYNEILGGCLPRVQLLSEARKRAIAARWFEVLGTKAPNGKVRFENAEDGVKWFASVFRKITKNAFWMGDNQSGFAVNFDWIFKPTNFLKVLEWHPPRS